MSFVSSVWDDLARGNQPIAICKALIDLFWYAMPLTARLSPGANHVSTIAALVAEPGQTTPIFDAFMSYSIEFAFWPDFAGNSPRPV